MKKNYFKKITFFKTITFGFSHVKNYLNNHLTGIFILLFGVFGMTNLSGQTTTVTTPGNYTFTVPCGVTSLTVQAWGGGGGGYGDNNENGVTGRGGGGGAYTTATLAVTSGQVINFTVGGGGTAGSPIGGNGGDTTFLTLTAGGGVGGNVGAGGTGGIATGGTTNLNGGTSTSTGSATAGAAGGAGAGPGGGAGGAGGGNGVNGTNGSTIGGGGGSSGDRSGGAENGGAGARGEIRITYTNPFATYCPPTFTSAVEPITNVTFAGINNTTSNVVNGTPALESFCDVANVQQGLSYPISLKGNSGGNFVNYYRVYVDWDQNGTFGNVGNEIYDIGTITNSTGIDAITLNGTITVPIGASLGDTRMRVMKRYNAYSTGPCQTGAGFGQAEDYTINVIAPAPCSGTPTAGTASVNPNTAWPGASYVVSATGYSLASNLTFQWQYSTDAGSTWTNAGAATSSYADYNATAPASGDVHWQLVVTCTNSSLSDTSTEAISVTMAVSDVETGCPNVVSGGLGLNGADPAPFNCTDTSTCVDLEATYLDLGSTTSYIVEPIAYNPPYAFNGLANPVSVNTDDVWSPIVNLPFDFCFYGTTYNQCLIGSNGVITFDTTNNTAGGTCDWFFDANLPIAGDTALIENSIFGVFHDIDPEVGGEVGWQLITLSTGCRALVASWYNVPLYGDNSQFYTGMMVLYENSNVIEVYIQNKPNDPDDWNDNNAIVGIQNADGTLASVAPGRNGLDTDWTATNEAWRFVPNGTSIASLTWYEGSGTSGPVLGTTDVLNVCPTATTTYTAEITYTLCDGRIITELDETTVTVNGAKVWNGSVDTDWDKANNWTPVGVPTAMDCVVIPDTANDPIISGTGYNGLGLNMSIEDDAVLTVNTDNAVTITDWVNINTTGELVLDNAASLIQTNNIANTGAGNMLMDRDVNIRRLDYVYWSSPVTSFLSSAISPGSPTSLIWKWIPTVTGNGIGNGGDWANGNETMTLGKGYIVRGPSSYTSTLQNFTATFVGTPNNGDISIPISRGSYTSATTYQICATCTPATNLDDNWNLVGNPYPSAIDANDFMTLNTNIDGYIKLWTHGTLPDSATADPFYEGFVYNYTIADYITYNHLGTLPSPDGFDGYIAAGQGFFVSMLDGGPATQNLNFTNALRSNTYDNGQFYRNTNNSVTSNEKHRIWLDIVNTTNNSSMTALIGYADGASNSRDRLYDAETDNKVTLNLFSLIDDVKFAIQGRQTPFDDNDVVPLGFRTPSNGIYSIGIKSIDGLFETTAQAIFLHDLELNIIHDLRVAPYSFTANAGTYNDRFVLRYTNETLGNNDFINDNSVMVISNTNLSVVSIQESIQSVLVFDVLGRLLVNKQNTNSLEVPLHEVQKNNAPLVVQITLTNGTKINKKVVY